MAIIFQDISLKQLSSEIGLLAFGMLYTSLFGLCMMAIFTSGQFRRSYLTLFVVQ